MRLPLLAFATVLLVVAAAHADEAPGRLSVGDKAPEFQATDAQGKPWKSSEHVGKKLLVVYFYPADFTGGCTKQACGFRDDMKTLQAQGVEVVGVSGDTPETHALFKEAYDLNYTLLADQDGSVAKKFGVPVSAGGTVKAEIDGQQKALTRGATIKRWTFIIDRDGRIAYKDAKVNAAEDSQAILAAVKKLTD